MNHGAGTHRARFQRDKEAAAIEAVISEGARCLAQSDNLGVGSWIAGADYGILPARNHLASTNDDGADRYFPGRIGLARFGKCLSHCFQVRDHGLNSTAKPGARPSVCSAKTLPLILL